jgi:hypothetical protein
MTFQEVEQIRNAFLSKAPDSYYLHHPNLDIRGFKYGGVSLFNGSTDHSEKVASFSVKAVDGQRMSVTLIIEWNSYEFIDEPELCIELIERFVPSFREQLANHSSNKILS